MVDTHCITAQCTNIIAFAFFVIGSVYDRIFFLLFPLVVCSYYWPALYMYVACSVWPLTPFL